MTTEEIFYFSGPSQEQLAPTPSGKKAKKANKSGKSKKARKAKKIQKVSQGLQQTQQIPGQRPSKPPQ